VGYSNRRKQKGLLYHCYNNEKEQRVFVPTALYRSSESQVLVGNLLGQPDAVIQHVCQFDNEYTRDSISNDFLYQGVLFTL
jgi:hypothetical protein